MNRTDFIGDYHTLLVNYLKINENEKIEEMMTGKIGRTLVHDPFARKLLDDEEFYKEIKSKWTMDNE